MKRFTFRACLAVFLIAGCSDGNGDKADGSVPLPDSGPAAYGADCQKDDDCESKLCFLKDGADKGICSKTCKRISDCSPVNGKLYDCGELPNGEIGCYPQTYHTVPYTQGHDCSLENKCAMGFRCMGNQGDADRYCASTCESDRDCPPKYRCATVRKGKELDPDKWCMRRQFCHPCVIDDQCGGPDDLCIKDSNGNHYCSKTCTMTGATCPGYAKCEDAGNNKLQCRHKAGFCFKSFDSDGELCDPCVVHGWTTTDKGTVTLAEDGICKKENHCILLDQYTGEGACVSACSSPSECPAEFGCGPAGPEDSDVCVPTKFDPNYGFDVIDTCQR